MYVRHNGYLCVMYFIKNGERKEKECDPAVNEPAAPVTTVPGLDPSNPG